MTGAERRDTVTRVSGVKVGHAEAPAGRTGVTVLRFDQAAPTVVRVLGGASATYDTGSLSLEATFGRRWAVFFSGGSLFGLDSARGIRGALLKEGAGHNVFGARRRVVPITGASLYDLPPEPEAVADYAPLGEAATLTSSRQPVVEGAVGAGSGATVGKYLGRKRASRGGVGSGFAQVPRLGAVGVLVVVNAVGAVRDPETGRWVSGARGAGGRIRPPNPRTSRSGGRSGEPGTTLVSVVTDTGLGRGALARVAEIAATGIARSVVPVYTATDGDVLFASTTGEGRRAPAERYPGELADRIGWLASTLVERAIIRAVRSDSRIPRAG